MHDPRLDTPSWRAIRRYWRQQASTGLLACQSPTCLAPHIPIQVGSPRGPWHLDVGHRSLRAADPRAEWTLADTRPEHARCNRRRGSTDRAQLLREQRRGRGERAPIVNSQVWRVQTWDVR